MSKSNEMWMIVGGLALAGVLIVGIEMLRRRRTDPLAQANRLITRCNEKISELEQSVAGIQSMVRAAA